MKKHTGRTSQKEKIWIWGVHSVEAALRKGRAVYQLCYTPQKADYFRGFKGEVCSVQELAQHLPKGVIHQGVALLTEHSGRVELEDLCSHKGPILVLDQVVDPHNLGALWRSAAAFEAQAIIISTDRSAQVCGVVTKAASGAVDHVPYCSVVNVSRTLEVLKKKGFFCVGLCETGENLNPRKVFQDVGVALVVGREGKGMRLLTRNCCDMLWKLNVSEDFSTLNASVAGAVALSNLYALKLRE